jgi:hypothetical protein
MCERGEKLYKVTVTSPMKRDHSEDHGVDGRIAWKWFLGKLAVRIWSGVIWFRAGTGGGIL